MFLSLYGAPDNLEILNDVNVIKLLESLDASGWPLSINVYRMMSEDAWAIT